MNMFNQYIVTSVFISLIYRGYEATAAIGQIELARRTEGRCGLQLKPEVFLSPYYKCVDKYLGKDSTPSGRIIGGMDTIEDMWKWFVLIDLQNFYGRSPSYCGGAIIDLRWIVSAAHCFEKRSGRFGSRLTTNDYPNIKIKTLGTNKHQFSIELVKFHPGRSSFTFGFNWKHDIVLIKTKETMNHSSIMPICIPRKRYLGYFHDVEAKIIGMGNIGKEPRFRVYPDKLREKVITLTICTSVNCGETCSCTQAGGGHWTMDSGDPVMVSEKHSDGDIWELAGLLSGGVNNDEVVIIEVYQYLNWIYDSIDYDNAV